MAIWVIGGGRHGTLRSLINFLPSAANLRRRKIISCPLCSLCNVHEEDVLHVAWGCTCMSWLTFVKKFEDVKSLFKPGWWRIELHSQVKQFTFLCWNRRNSRLFGSFAKTRFASSRRCWRLFV